MAIATKHKKEIKLGLCAIISLCIAFSPLLCNFIWGNHDWIPLIFGNRISSGLIEGRFSQFALQCLLFSGKILPILNISLGFTFYATAIVIIYTRFFNFSVTKHSYLTIISVVLLPYICEILYFQFIVLSQLSWPLIIALSLIIAKKASETTHYIVYTFLSTILLLTAIGGYPACANLFVTAATLWLINQKQTSFIRLTKLALPFFISLCLSFLCLYIIHIWLREHNQMIEMYNNRYSSLIGYLQKILPTLGIAIKSLLQPQPFFSLALKIILTIATLFGLSEIFIACKTVSQKTICLTLIACLLLSLKFSALVSSQEANDYFTINDPIEYMVRADFYSIPCLILYCLSRLSTHKKLFLKNTATIICTFLIFINLKTDINFSKVQILGFHGEALLQERIINRLEESPQYLPNNYYTIVQTGEISLRPKYYQTTKLEKYGLYTLKTPFSRHWLANENYNFYAPFEFVLSGRSISKDDITPQMFEYLLKEEDIWPSPKATYINDKYYIIPLTTDGKKMLSDQFRQL